MKGQKIKEQPEKDRTCELMIAADTEKLPAVLAFLEEHLEKSGCPARAQMQIAVAAEEIFVNIAHYAYGPEGGEAVVRLEISENPPAAEICFLDRGRPFDPLARQDPDVTLSAEDREIGGLGIFMTKKLADEVGYTHRDGWNILRIKKGW